jgi:hypothetical protein
MGEVHMNQGRVGEDRGSKVMDGCPLTNASTMSGFSQLQCLLMVIPADENARSLETDDAMMGSISCTRDTQTSY